MSRPAAASDPVPAVAIVGAGAMGTALAHAWANAGIPIAAIASRTPERAEALAARIFGARVLSLDAVAGAAPVVVLAVSDNAIEETCAAVVARLPLPSVRPLIVHVSGSRPADTLTVAADWGALTGAFHPLAAVARGEPLPESDSDAYPRHFRGGTVAIEGDAVVYARLAPLATALGATPFPIVAADKPLYHLGASMLAAFSVGLAEIARQQMLRAQASPELARMGVAHLLRTVADNIGRAPDPASAMTGPVMRGDVEGLARQARTAGALSPAARGIYRAHGAHTIELARGAGRIDAALAARLAAVLRDMEAMPAVEDHAGRTQTHTNPERR